MCFCLCTEIELVFLSLFLSGASVMGYERVSRIQIKWIDLGLNAIIATSYGVTGNAFFFFF